MVNNEAKFEFYNSSNTKKLFSRKCSIKNWTVSNQGISVPVGSISNGTIDFVTISNISIKQINKLWIVDKQTDLSSKG